MNNISSLKVTAFGHGMNVVISLANVISWLQLGQFLVENCGLRAWTH